MRRIIIFLLILASLTISVSATEITAPVPPADAEDLMPAVTNNFFEDLMEIINNALQIIAPEIRAAGALCASLVGICILVSMLRFIPGASERITDIAAVVVISVLLLQSSHSMIGFARDTIRDMSEYGKLLLPVMTTALAAEGGLTSSGALYACTVIFDTILTSAIPALLIPLVYMYLAVSVAQIASGDESLKKIRDFIKWLCGWGLKTVLYIFTGFMGITNVVSGTADAAALKAAKLTISGMVPVVGGILSDASESVLIGASVVKNAVGIYGLLAMIAIWIGPFLSIGIQYLTLKLTGAFSSVFQNKTVSELTGAFATAMGLLLAMTGAVCYLQLISTVCFMKGVA